jgi:hypothetical protein
LPRKLIPVDWNPCPSISDFARVAEARSVEEATITVAGSPWGVTPGV